MGGLSIKMSPETEVVYSEVSVHEYLQGRRKTNAM
jgi:hypothetical protein